MCNRALEEQLQLAATVKEVGKRDTAPVKHESKKCSVLGDSVTRNVGTKHYNMTVESFRGI
jgi:hypothetical protein